MTKQSRNFRARAAIDPQQAILPQSGPKTGEFEPNSPKMWGASGREGRHFGRIWREHARLVRAPFEAIWGGFGAFLWEIRAIWAKRGVGRWTRDGGVAYVRGPFGQNPAWGCILGEAGRQEGDPVAAGVLWW